MNTIEKLALVRSIPTGQIWGISPRAAAASNRGWYLFVRRLGAEYQVEAGIRASHDQVAEHDEDVQDAFREWDTAACTVQTAEEALSLYETAKERLSKLRITAEGALRS